MTAFLADWRRLVVDGGLLFLAPDPMFGVVRIRTDVARRPVREVVADIARPVAGASFEPFAPPRVFVTAEGEQAVIFDLVARPRELVIRRSVAVIIGDQSLVTIDGRAVRPDGHDIGARVQELATHFTLGLGSDRWRAYFYQPPPGWNRRARFQAEVWFHPDYPVNGGVITAFRARPLETPTSLRQHARLFEDMPGEFGRDEPVEQVPLQVPSGLKGKLSTFRAAWQGGVRLISNVALTDGQRLYLLRLETDEAHRDGNAAVFGGVVSSVAGIAGAEKKAAPADFSPWTE
jgi:hypothetical protein